MTLIYQTRPRRSAGHALVANSQNLAISYVIWRDHIWSLDRAAEGWREYSHPSGSTSTTLRHLDHIHVSAL